VITGRKPRSNVHRIGPAGNRIAGSAREPETERGGFGERERDGAIGEGLPGAAADDIGRLDDLVADDQQDVARTVVVLPLGFSVEGREASLMRPGLRPLDGDALFFEDRDEHIQVLFRRIPLIAAPDHGHPDYSCARW
jgi:hypothetical protein